MIRSLVIGVASFGMTALLIIASATQGSPLIG